MSVRLLFLLLSAVVLLAARKITAEETVLPPAMYRPVEPATTAVTAGLYYRSPAMTALYQKYRALSYFSGDTL